MKNLNFIALQTVVLVLSLIASIAFASAESSGKFDSLEGRTQIEAAGSAYYDSYNGFDFYTSATGIHYILPHFGIGGVASLSQNSYDKVWNFGVGPSLEYFIPVSERGQIIFQGRAMVSAAFTSSSNLTVGARAGYRSFVSDDIALSVTLGTDWYRDIVTGSPFRAGNMNMRFGFSLFF